MERIIEQSIATVFADGLCMVMAVGDVTHLVFTARTPTTDDGGTIYRTTEVRVVVPNSCLQQIGRMILSGNQRPSESESIVAKAIAVN
jgi:hypothetical protein